MVVLLARAGFGTAKEITDMDLLSFQSACGALSRVVERENTPEPVKDERGSGFTPDPKANLTKDQQNLSVLSKVKVKRAR